MNNLKLRYNFSYEMIQCLHKCNQLLWSRNDISMRTKHQNLYSGEWTLCIMHIVFRAPFFFCDQQLLKILKSMSTWKSNDLRQRYILRNPLWGLEYLERTHFNQINFTWGHWKWCRQSNLVNETLKTQSLKYLYKMYIHNKSQLVSIMTIHYLSQWWSCIVGGIP